MAELDIYTQVRARRLARVMLCSTGFAALLAAQPAQAQGSVVSACSGVSLPRSVVTDLISPVVTGITGPLEGAINPLLGILVPPLDLDATGLLARAASGAPITLQAIAADGTLVGPSDQCVATSDAITLDTPAGVAIGGNRITGLGANGAAAFASDIDAIALGNNARAEAGATGGLALGSGAGVTAANSVALGAGSRAGRGALGGYTAVGLAAPQASAGEVSIGAPGALRQLTNVAAGSAPDDAATVGQVSGVLAQVTALDAATVRYDGATRDRVTLAGAGGTTLANVAPGTLAIGSTEAVNGAQLFATNQQVAANTAAIAGLGTGSLGPVRYSSAATPTVPNGGTVTDDVTLVGAGGGAVGLHNVRDGGLAAGSTDAVNGGQLFATNQAVAGNTAAITNLDNRVTNTETQIGGLTTTVTNNTTAITNLQTDLGTTNTNLVSIDARVTANTTAITNLTNTISGSTVSPVQYSDAATPTTPNGGTLTNDVTLVGANTAAPVALHNVASGAVVAGSTDAVNGGQLAAVATTASNSLQYDRDAFGARTNSVTLAGGTASAPVAINNVAAGTLSAASTQAVNGSQLYATQQVAQQAAAASANSVQYDVNRTSVTFGGGTTAVTLRNVAAGTSATDAVNVGQLQTGLQNAVAQAAGYTDARIEALATSLDFDLRRVRRGIGAGSSTALAAAGLPQPSEPGRSMVAIGGGTYRGESAVAFGLSTFLKDGHSIVRVAATYDSRGHGGANAGFGYQF